MPSLSTYIVCLAAIIGLFYYKKFKNTKYIYFIYYLVFTFIIELLGYLFGHVFLIYNIFIYNIYTLITFLFYFIFYKSVYKKRNNKKLMNKFILVYLLFIIVDLIVFKPDFFNDLFINDFVFGSVLLLITLILFLFEIISDKMIIFNFRKAFIFWVSIGVLLFYIGIIPVIISSEFLKFNGLFDTVVLGLNIIMYGSFITGFILSDKKYNY